MPVVALGFAATEVAGIPVVDPSADLADTVEWVGSMRSEVGTLILVRDSVRGAGGTHRARLLKALAHDPDIALVTVTAPVTRADLLRRLLADWVPALSPIDLFAVVPALDAALRTVAVVGSLSNLRKPAPSVLQHAMGMLPGARFGVDMDRGTVTGARRGFEDFPSPLDAPGAQRPAVRLSQDGAGLVELLPDAGPAVSEVDPALVSSKDYWGASRWAELSVLHDTPDNIVSRALAEVPRLCPECTRAVRGPGACPFCGVMPTPHETSDEEVLTP